MTHALRTMEFEALVDRLMASDALCSAGRRLGDMKTFDLVREVDTTISALRTIVARRLEVSIDPYWQSLEARYAMSMANDPGLVAINRAIEHIAAEAGIKRAEAQRAVVLGDEV